MTVGDLERRMTMKEYEGWHRFFTKWRMPFEQADLSAALLSSIVANIMRGKDQPAFKPLDFRVSRRFGFDEPVEEAPKTEAEKHRAAFGR